MLTRIPATQLGEASAASSSSGRKGKGNGYARPGTEVVEGGMEVEVELGRMEQGGQSSVEDPASPLVDKSGGRGRNAKNAKKKGGKAGKAGMGGGGGGGGGDQRNSSGGQDRPTPRPLGADIQGDVAGPQFAAGDRVEAFVPGWTQHYAGTVRSYNRYNGRYAVSFDDGEHRDNVKPRDIRFAPGVGGGGGGAMGGVALPGMGGGGVGGGVGGGGGSQTSRVPEFNRGAAYDRPGPLPGSQSSRLPGAPRTDPRFETARNPARTPRTQPGY